MRRRVVHRDPDRGQYVLHQGRRYYVTWDPDKSYRNHYLWVMPDPYRDPDRGQYVLHQGRYYYVPDTTTSMVQRLLLYGHDGDTSSDSFIGHAELDLSQPTGLGVWSANHERGRPEHAEGGERVVFVVGDGTPANTHYVTESHHCEVWGKNTVHYDTYRVYWSAHDFAPIARTTLEGSLGDGPAAKRIAIDSAIRHYYRWVLGYIGGIAGLPDTREESRP